MKLLFLVDSDAKNIQWMHQYFDENNYTTIALGMKSSMKNRTVKWRSLILYYKYILLSIRAIRKSTRQDIIVSGNFIVGAFAAFFCRIFFIKRTILALNMISHKKGLVNRVVRKIVYNTAFKYPEFYITVNSGELITSYAKEFNVNESHFSVLPDPIMNYYEKAPFTKGNGAVFCGGEAMRDWDTLFKAARMLPGVSFIAIARKKYFDKTLSAPQNVTLHFDKAYDFFYDQLKESSIVAMPLTTTAPAGLIVMIRAAMLSKPIIITSTSSTRTYIDNKYNGILIDQGDEQTLANEIAYLLSDDRIREDLCNRMSETVKKFSLENYSKIMESIILKVKGPGPAG
ncbi:MAG: glycosyltransferase [Ferruginibacter sp.]